MHRSKRTHLWCWFLKQKWNLERDARLFQCEFHLYNGERSKFAVHEFWRQRSKNGAPSFRQHFSDLSNHLLVFFECLRCRVAGRFGSLGKRWFCWNERESPDDTNLADTHDWLGMTQNRWKIDCNGHMLWKYCKSTDIDELQGSNWPFGSNCSGKLPSLHFTWLHKSHGRPRSCKKQLTKAFMDGPFCVNKKSFEQVYLYTYKYVYTCK